MHRMHYFTVCSKYVMGKHVARSRLCATILDFARLGTGWQIASHRALVFDCTCHKRRL